MLCGTSPIPASSGKTVLHRLNRGGNRQANTALYRIVLVPDEKPAVQGRSCQRFARDDA